MMKEPKVGDRVWAIDRGNNPVCATIERKSTFRDCWLVDPDHRNLDDEYLLPEEMFPSELDCLKEIHEKVTAKARELQRRIDKLKEITP